jgi:hypothetical protein
MSIHRADGHADSRVDQRLDQLGQGPSEVLAGFPLQAANWAGAGGAESPLDPVEAYFECITTCSLDDGECVTSCTEILREQS